MLRVVACGAAGVLGDGGPGRPRDRHTRASLGVVDLEARPCPPDPPAPSTPVGPGVLTCACTSARSPARPRRRPRAPQPGPASKPVQALRILRHPSHQWGRVADVCLSFAPRSLARPRRRPSMSHVIPLRLVQTLNLHRWNCNVFGVSRKMTALNYVRNLGGGGVVAARGHRILARGRCDPSKPAPQRKALIKGKWPPVKAVTSLDNGRKWRVYAGRTLELLR